ncbi:uncharacterized protein SPEM3-like [Choloepus didactylus]|uniref:uncharacterized protein SPEM3-like n=1 Tax=Choloepus didactylus TaxID=27675 RepID=UPI00189D75A9|nr:uncharacterized protein SPEM3-like [Choloepus didactylus]
MDEEAYHRARVCSGSNPGKCQEMGDAILLFLGTIILLNVGFNAVTMLWAQLKSLRNHFNYFLPKDTRHSCTGSHPRCTRCSTDPKTQSPRASSRFGRRRNFRPRHSNHQDSWVPDRKAEKASRGGRMPPPCGHTGAPTEAPWGPRKEEMMGAGKASRVRALKGQASFYTRPETPSQIQAPIHSLKGQDPNTSKVDMVPLSLPQETPEYAPAQYPGQVPVRPSAQPRTHSPAHAPLTHTHAHTLATAPIFAPTPPPTPASATPPIPGPTPAPASTPAPACVKGLKIPPVTAPTHTHILTPSPSTLAAFKHGVSTTQVVYDNRRINQNYVHVCRPQNSGYSKKDLCTCSRPQERQGSGTFGQTLKLHIGDGTNSLTGSGLGYPGLRNLEQKISGDGQDKLSQPKTLPYSSERRDMDSQAPVYPKFLVYSQEAASAKPCLHFPTSAQSSPPTVPPPYTLSLPLIPPRSFVLSQSTSPQKSSTTFQTPTCLPACKSPQPIPPQYSTVSKPLIQSQFPNIQKSLGLTQDLGLQRSPCPSKDSSIHENPGPKQNPGLQKNPGHSQASYLYKSQNAPQDAGLYKTPGLSQQSAPQKSPGLAQDAGMLKGPSFTQPSGLQKNMPFTQTSNFQRCLGIIQDSGVCRNLDLIQETAVYHSQNHLQANGPHKSPGPAQDFGGCKTTGVVRDPGVFRSLGLTQHSGLQKSPALSQDSGINRSPGFAQTSELCKGPGLIQDLSKTQVNRNLEHTQDRNLHKGPGINPDPGPHKGPALTLDSGLSKIPGLNQESGLHKDSSLVQDPGLHKCPGLVRGTGSAQGPLQTPKSTPSLTKSSISKDHPQKEDGEKHIPWTSVPLSQNSCPSKAPGMCSDLQTFSEVPVLIELKPPSRKAASEDWVYHPVSTVPSACQTYRQMSVPPKIKSQLHFLGPGARAGHVVFDARQRQLGVGRDKCEALSPRRLRQETPNNSGRSSKEQ